MRKNFLLAVCLALSTPALAEPDPIPEPQSTLERMEDILNPANVLRGQLSEEDVSELFAVLRSQFTANPRELSPHLKQKLDAIAQRLQIRGALAGSLLLDEMESKMKEFVREMNKPPRDPNAI
ncbi:MAG: hypothetical protein ACREV9_17830 [Burkholderiales bacterium]